MRKLLCISAALTFGVLLAQSEREVEVAKAGEAWLSLIDHQQYEESWKAASESFRNQVKIELWTQSLKRYREPMGGLVSRTSPKVDFAKELKGAPDGEYAIIHFQTSYEKKDSVTERLTLVREDGTWKALAFALH
jgi:hypothetical protein